MIRSGGIPSRKLGAFRTTTEPRLAGVRSILILPEAGKPAAGWGGFGGGGPSLLTRAVLQQLSPSPALPQHQRVYARLRRAMGGGSRPSSRLGLSSPHPTALPAPPAEEVTRGPRVGRPLDHSLRFAVI